VIAEIGGSLAASPRSGLQAITPRRMRIFPKSEPPIHPREGPAGGLGLPRLQLGETALPDEAIAAWFPDFTVNRERRGTRAGAAQGVPFVRLGEGLLRAPPHGRGARPCLSATALVLSGPGSPADCLDTALILADRGWETPALLARAAAARAALLDARVAGAWWEADGESELPPQGYALVALTEPTLAGAEAAVDEMVLGAMLDTAFAENPAERILILAPGGGASRLFKTKLAAAATRGAAIVSPALDPWALLDRAEKVYSAGGELGFLALLAGRTVAAFGRSFYTGWGLTRDMPGVPQHGFSRTLDEVFAAHCLLATRYRDPFRNTPASFEETLDLLALWREVEIANRRIAVCVGMSFWKRRRVADFLRSTAGVPVFRRTAAPAIAAASRGAGAEPGAIAVWASRIPEGLVESAAHRHVPLIRVEDGFIRSVGLGSDFMPAASLVFDRRGMYYDPRSPSDLETLLRQAEFAPALVERSGRLIAQLVTRGVTKYNLASPAPRLDIPAGVRRIFVPGQVEDDLSVLFGGGEIRGNLDLLAQVRAANPDAFILYKPHPDVVAGHRKGAVSETAARRFADAVVENVSTAALLAGIDELHTLTSLAGFEALLRRRRVVVYGRPFYAGWGLTTDMAAIDRRRRLSLEELVAGVLILYPRYLDPVTRLPCGPEVVIERLDHPELWRPGLLVLARRWQGELARRLGEIRLSLRAAGSVR
jgi:capsular polysaccharide export protein